MSGRSLWLSLSPLSFAVDYSTVCCVKDAKNAFGRNVLLRDDGLCPSLEKDTTSGNSELDINYNIMIPVKLVAFEFDVRVKSAFVKFYVRIWLGGVAY